MGIEDLFESELVPWLRLNDHRHRVTDLRPGITLAGYIQAATGMFNASSFAIQPSGIDHCRVV